MSCDSLTGAFKQTPGSCGGAVASSVEASPCSSIGSHHRVVAYGCDINYDFLVADFLEGWLGREIEHTELIDAIRSFEEEHRQAPTIRQLASVLAAVSTPRSFPPTPCYGTPAAQNAAPPAVLQAITPSASEFPQQGYRPRHVPGLNLFGVKKTSPCNQEITSPCTAHGDVMQGASEVTKPAPRTPDSSSPLDILKVIIPTVYKPRAGGRGDWHIRDWGINTPTGAQAPRSKDLEDDLEVPAGSGLDAHDQRQPGRFRVSMDDTDQHQPGLHRASAQRVDQRLSASPADWCIKGAMSMTTENRSTPGSCGRRQQGGNPCDKAPRSSYEKASPVHVNDVKFFAAKRQLCLEAEAQDAAGVDSGDDIVRQYADVSKQAVKCLNSSGLGLLAAAPQPLKAEPSTVPPSKVPGFVPPLALPSQLVTARSHEHARPSTRCGPRAGSSACSTSLASTRVPQLGLSGPASQQARFVGTQGPPPSGARTRRLSVTLPVELLYGDGPLTVRRMAAGAVQGVTSYALETVFWAESEDELGESDGTAYDTDEERAHEGSIMGDEVHKNGQHGWRRRRATRKGARSNCNGASSDAYGTDLMLPEELWNVWERLSDAPKGRQYSLLESLTNVERIACTSYSTVSKACHDGQPVVVKIYDVAERDKLANAFAEIGVLLHLAHWPGAVKLLDYGRSDDKVMLMLESCDCSLKNWCDSRRFKDTLGSDYIVECLRLWCNLAELLTELHEHFHVAHCDLKPGNVLLAGGRLRLADFSESMLFRETPLLLDQARGTVSHQPPEMFHTHCVDARKADVWAMGCILYEMITGELLFKGNSDALRVVTSGNAAASRQLQRLQNYARNRLGGSGAGGEIAGGRSSISRSGTKSCYQQQHRLGSSTSGQFSSCELGPGAGADAVQAAATFHGHNAMERKAPRVPRLPLGLARPPTTSPWRAQALGPHPPHAGAPVLPHHLLSSRSGFAGATGRSLELIAEGSGTEDASSIASDPWTTVSAMHTAPTTARSHVPVDTARSIASASTAAAAWPPPPPPSAGTARSVAESEWTLAAPNNEVPAAASGGLEGAPFCPAEAEYGAAEDCSAVDASPTEIVGMHTPGPLPPHRRLRHSVATQCSDPAGPDWLTTEEADHLRIMAEEAPSFVLAPRCLSGADGPSLCDDVLGLLRVVLVEDHVRPSMREVTRLAATVLQRHAASAANGAAELDLAAGTENKALRVSDKLMASGGDFSDQAHNHVDLSLGFRSLTAEASQDAWRQSAASGTVHATAGATQSVGLASPGGDPMLQSAGRGHPQPSCYPRLDLMALHQALSAQCAADTGVGLGRSTLGTDGGGSWTDGSSLGGAEISVTDLGGGSDGGGRSFESDLFVGRAVNLFDVCQPLVTARGSRSYSRSWKRFLG